MPEKVLLIVNPVSGRIALKQKLWQVIDKLCAADMVPTVCFTQKRGDAEKMAAECPAEIDKVICAGGDGTLNEVISGLMQNPFEHILGYIPVGTTNDLANSLGISKGVLPAVDDIIAGNTTTIDIGSFGGRYFNYIASFGAFTEASYNAPQEVKNTIGHAAYIFEGLKSLGNISPHKVKFIFDDKYIEGDFIFAAISNTTSLGGVLKLDDNKVALNDGLFEVLLIKEPKNLAQFQKIVSELMSQKFTQDLVSLYHASSVIVETDEKLDWTLDGEHQTGDSKVIIQNISHAVKLIVPKNRKK